MSVGTIEARLVICPNCHKEAYLTPNLTWGFCKECRVYMVEDVSGSRQIVKPDGYDSLPSGEIEL